MNFTLAGQDCAISAKSIAKERSSAVIGPSVTTQDLPTETSHESLSSLKSDQQGQREIPPLATLGDSRQNRMWWTSAVVRQKHRSDKIRTGHA